MNSSIPLAVLTLVCLGRMATAQETASPVADALRSRVQRAGHNLVAAAEAMPAGKYDFKPTPSQMSFGEVVAHVAAGGDALCSSLAGVSVPRRADPGKAASKEKLVGRLREAMGFCETALAKVGDSSLGAKVPYLGAGEISRADAMFATAEELAGHYSQLAIYLRLNGVLPPTARREG